MGNKSEKTERKKVSIAVPFQQHSFRAARGFIENGMMHSYYTSVYNDDKGIYKVLARVLPKGLVIRMQGRNDMQITPYVQKFAEFYGLLYLGVCRISRLRKYTPFIRKKLFRKFGTSVAKACIKSGTEVVVAYDTQAYDLFQELIRKNSPIIKVLDMASTSALKIREIVDTEMAKSYPFSESLERHNAAYSDKKCIVYKQEMELADYLLVPSGFVKDSLHELGIPENRIIYLPHGVDIEMFTPSYKEYIPGKTLKFLFVGRVEAAKGIYYILEAFKQLQDLNIELIVVGDVMNQREKLEAYTSNARFLGLKRRDEMPEYYKEADVFILSSLWEGSSLSMLEALAAGLPVIASKYSCAPEVVKEYEEGFVVEPRNVEQMKEKIRWYCEHAEKIPKMSRKARKTAEEYTWVKYGENISKIIEQM